MAASWHLVPCQHIEFYCHFLYSTNDLALLCMCFACSFLQLDGGFFNAIGGTAIKAFDASGAELSTVSNTKTEVELLGLATNDGSPLIKGLLFSLVGAEGAGFGIDNVQFTYGCCP